MYTGVAVSVSHPFFFLHTAPFLPEYSVPTNTIYRDPEVPRAYPNRYNNTDKRIVQTLFLLFWAHCVF